ncbi:MAG TPA: hypothetical protein VI968_01590 [archaeon]|nr:hypothetical protein [archaeon]
MDFFDALRYGRVRQESRHLGNLAFYVGIIEPYEIVVVKDEFRGWPNLSETQKMSGQEAATYVKSLRTHEKPNNGSTYRFKAYESAVVLEIKGSDDFGRFTRKITVCPTREA